MLMENKRIAIQLDNLSKTYIQRRKTVPAVQNLSLSVEAGQVFGFLGPNGAGKSTTIRMLLDLIRPTAGKVEIYGRSPHSDHAVLERVGSLVDGANFYKFLSGRKNLNILSKTSGWHNPARIQTVLEQVDMAKDADRPVSGYSTGMKQRLGIAAALLNNPDLLILDEPTNGLDPSGIKEIRTFIRSLAENHGKTVFISSHLLSEIEQMCDAVAIINKGQLIQVGRVTDLLSAQHQIVVEAKPIDKALQLLQSHWSVVLKGDTLVVNAPPTESPLIVNHLSSHAIAVHQVMIQRQSLEDFFMSVTGGKEKTQKKETKNE